MQCGRRVHVLLTTDLSAASRLTIPYVVGLRTGHQDLRVTVLYADDSDGLYGPDPHSEAMHELSELKAERLGEFAKQLAEHGLDATVVEVPGPPTAAICDWASDHDVDLLVLTRHGVRPGGVLMGSTSQRVVRAADRPTLIVHDPVGPRGGPAPNEGSPRRIHRLLVGTDLSEDSRRGLRALLDAFGFLDLTLRVVQVWRTPAWASLLPSERHAAAVDAVRRDIEVAHERRLREWLAETTDHPVERALVHGDEPAESLIAEAQRWGADAIAAPSHGKGALTTLLMGSTTSRLLTLSPLPVLVLPRRWSHSYELQSPSGSGPSNRIREQGIADE